MVHQLHELLSNLVFQEIILQLLIQFPWHILIYVDNVFSSQNVLDSVIIDLLNKPLRKLSTAIIINGRAAYI